MQELSMSMLLATSEELFGKGLFWGLVVFAILVLVFFGIGMVRGRKGFSKHLKISPILGAILAVVIIHFMTSSGFKDLGGGVDYIILALIAVFGAVALTVTTYGIKTMMGCCCCKKCKV